MKLEEQTIRDFGDQWTRYTDSPGYYGSLDFLADVFGPLMDIKNLRGKKVAEVGSGTGRIISMLLEAGVDRVTAVEPSKAYDVLVKNLEKNHSRVSFLRESRQLGVNDYDYIFSIGVIHHIPEPKPVLAAIYKAIKPGGKFFMWVYGKENNEKYLSLANLLRSFTTKLPHFILVGLVWILFLFLKLYIYAAKFLPLPLKSYLTNVLGKCSNYVIRLGIYDQLNPAYAKYYGQDEVLSLLEEAGFADIKIYHRHKYSWSATGHKL